MDRELTPVEMAYYRFEAGVLAAVKSNVPRIAAPADLLLRISESIRKADERG